MRIPQSPEATLPESHHKASFWTLTLGAIGVVYGDIGTSPLYAMRETVAAATGGHHGSPVALTRELVISILSLLLWALILDGHGQIRLHPAAGRQQGRGRLADPGRPDAARARHAEACPC